jgi:sugar/nucleoside kinase (ribokinase family)
MNRLTLALLGTVLAAGAMSAAAHHSFAIYDMQQDVEFHGVIATVKFRNPHMAMTLTVTDDKGGQRAINFVEGAPANMLARLGLKPEFIQPGQEITAIGAPRHDDPNAWFLKAIILPDGTRFNALQSPNQQR